MGRVRVQLDDDAVYAAGRLLWILSRTEKKLSELLADVPRYHNTPEIRVDCPDEVKFEIVRKITAEFKCRHEVVDIDGARVLFGDGWGLIRASNTQAGAGLEGGGQNTRGAGADQADA